MFQTIFVEPLFNVLFTIFALIPGHDFGLAVIGLTVFVRLLLWPLVTRQLHSQKKMQKLQPEAMRLREQHKDDRQKQTEALMELYKKHGTSPFAPILPILLQFPILYALFVVFNNSLHAEKIKELTYGFVQQLEPVAALIANNSIFDPTLFGLIDLTKPHILLAVGAGAAQFVQAKMLQPKTPPEGEMARMMNSMIVLFPVMTIVFAMFFPSALALYWMFTSVVAVFQQWWVLKRDTHELEEVAEAVVVITESSTAGATKPKPKPRKKRPSKGGAR